MRTNTSKKMKIKTYIENMNNCNAPSRYLDAVKYGGFDAVVLSNNHNCDGGKKALLQTIDEVEKYQFAYTGVFRNNSDKRFFIVDVNGIKIGFLSYMSKDTGFNGKDKSWSQEDMDTLLNVFTPEKAKKDINDCKACGAEYIIVYMHWGKKNYYNVTDAQVKEAHALAEAGADYIVGSNPHLVQKYDEIITPNGRTVPCFYSIGNFQAVMNQVEGNRDSVMVRIRLQRNEEGNVYLFENNYIPCHTYTECKANHWAPIALSNNYNNSILKKNRNKFLKRITQAIGTKITAL